MLTILPPATRKSKNGARPAAPGPKRGRRSDRTWPSALPWRARRMRRPPPATTTGTWFVDGRRYIVSLWGRVTVGPQPALKCRGKLRFGSRIEPVEGARAEQGAEGRHLACHLPQLAVHLPTLLQARPEAGDALAGPRAGHPVPGVQDRDRRR